ncbi:MAG TPA: DUF5668 domain-containing protein [Candidatus Angelobacter sp.]
MNCAIHTEAPATAFCRTCGKALCENCKRDVMGAIYCEPCIAVRLQGAVPVAPMPVAAQIVEGAPNPALAGVLAAFVPGLGAMYNGQFVKAFVHVVIFASLIMAVSNGYFGAEPLFGILIGFFWFYMIFDAIKSAKAKQLGLPTPDPLGLDNLFGIQESHPPAQRPVAGVGATPGVAQPQRAGHDNTPSGAIVLIVLGVFFLLGNVSEVRMHKMWPLLLIGFGLWIAYKRTFERR